MRNCLYRGVLLWILILLSALSNAQTVKEFKFTGLKRTRASYLVDHIIQTKVGDTIDSTILAKDVQEIYNVRHFAFVKYNVLPVDSGNVIIEFVLKETLSVIPAIEIGATRDFYKLKLGYVDFNTWGRSGLTNMYVQKFGRVTFFLNGNYPFTLKGKNGLAFDLYYLGTIEPIYYQKLKNTYDYNLFNAMLMHRYDFNVRSFLKTGIGYQVEKFRPNELVNVPMEYPAINTTTRYTYRLNYRYTKINLNRMTQKGFYFDASYNGVISTVNPSNPLQGNAQKLLLDARVYKNPFPTGNIAVRLRLGIGKAALFDQFVLDDNTNIRGIGFKRVRRNYEFVINAEHRQTIFQHPLGIIQAVVFNDFSIDYNYYGGGLHFYLEPIHGIVFRMDYGMNIKNHHDAGFVIGIHQYF